MIPHARIGRSRIALLFSVIFGLAWATPTLAVGPFPAGTTVFVDVTNTSGNEDGSSAHPFSTIQEGIDAALNGDVVGVAAGTYKESIALASGIAVIGVDPKSTVIHAGNDAGDAVRLIQVNNVRVSGFTIMGALFEGGVPGGAGIFVNFPAKTIRIDHNIITRNDFGISVFNAPFYVPGGLVIDSNLIVQNKKIGIFRAGDAVIRNNVIARNGTNGITINGDSASATVINNTIAHNGKHGVAFWNNVDAAITNNVISHNGGFGIDVYASNNSSAVRPHVTFNLFFSNSAGNFSDIGAPLGTNSTLESAAQINSLQQNWGNVVGDPQHVNAAANDFHVAPGSAAIDAGTNLNAPKRDFDGTQRPVDGDGNCVFTTDIGAFEAPPLQAFVLCRVVFPEQWIAAGCEVIDCCPFCPGIFDWVIRVDGDPVSEVVLRFENLAPWEVETLRIKGNAEWLDGGRLRIFGTGQTAIYGLPLDTKGNRAFDGRVRATVEAVSSDDSRAGGQPRRLRVSVDELIAGRILDTDVLHYEYSF